MANNFADRLRKFRTMGTGVLLSMERDELDECAAEIDRLESKLGTRSWVPFNERRPERWQQVLVSIIHAGKQLVPHAMMTWDGEHFTLGVTDNRYSEDASVTHWMPLPEPPT